MTERIAGNLRDHFWICEVVFTMTPLSPRAYRLLIIEALGSSVMVGKVPPAVVLGLRDLTRSKATDVKDVIAVSKEVAEDVHRATSLIEEACAEGRSDGQAYTPGFIDRIEAIKEAAELLDRCVTGLARIRKQLESIASPVSEVAAICEAQGKTLRGH